MDINFIIEKTEVKNKEYYIIKLMVPILDNKKITLNTDICRSLFNLHDIDEIKRSYNMVYSENISIISVLKNYDIMFNSLEDCNRFLDLLNSIIVIKALE